MSQVAASKSRISRVSIVVSIKYYVLYEHTRRNI